MSEDIFSKKENAFDALLEEFGVTEGVEAPPETTTNDFNDLFGTQPPAEPEKTEPTAEPKKAPNFDDLLADMPTTKVKASPKSNDLDVPTKAEETPSLFDDLLTDAKPAKPKKEKKEPEHIPDKSEDYRVPNDVLHLNKVPKPDNSWEAEAADIVIPEVKPKDTKEANPTKGANPFGNTTPNATPTKGANPFGNTAPGASPTKGANPFGNTTKSAAPTKGANPFGNVTKGANPFDNPTKAPDNFNPFIKQEPAKEALWTSPGEFDYDQLAEKIVEKLIQKIAQKLK